MALWPPAEVVESIAALPRPEVLGLRWTRPHQWHVTLRFLGSVDEAGPVVSALAAVAACPPAAAAVGPALGRFGHRILHVPVDGLADVAAATVAATRHLGEPPDDRPFAGHITLARAANRVRVDLRPLAGTPLSAEWPVTEVTLVESRGGRYEVLETVALAG